MALPSTVEIPYGQEKQVTTGKRRALGTRGVTPDGRVFYYARAGATALASNIVVQAKAQEGTTQTQNSVTPSTAVGDWSATAAAPGIQLGKTSIGVDWATAHSSGEYVDGYMVVEGTPGGGMYRIVEDRSSGSSNTDTIIRLHPDDGIQVAVITTVTDLAFHANPYSSVIVAPTALTNAVMGVTPVSVPIDNYFWLQTYGPGAVRYNDLVAAVAGMEVMAGAGATAGDAIGAPVSTDTTTGAITSTAGVIAYANQPRIGTALVGIPGDAELLKVMLSIRA